MPDANALSFKTLQDAVLGRRFPAASERTNAKRWLSTAYQDVWTAADWTFRRVSRQNFPQTSGSSTPTMPVDFGQAIDLYDDSGYPLEYLSQRDFEYAYGPTLVAGTTGSPAAFTVVNRQIYIAPKPGNVSFALSYYRRLCSRTGDLAIKAGMMTADTDYPFWDDNHSILIARAISIGLQEINDPTWQDPQGEFERQLERMKEDYEQVRPQMQWGAYAY